MGNEGKVRLYQLPSALAGGSVQQRAIGYSQRQGKQQFSFPLLLKPEGRDFILRFG
jgi:hypothetical protein